MIAKQFHLTDTTHKLIEPVLKDENIHYMHMVLPTGEGLPVHTTNATVYMTVLQGTLTLRLEEEPPQKFLFGTVLKIPMGVIMDAKNLESGLLELVVVKAPAPKAEKSS